jgi:hypothetical protein
MSFKQFKQKALENPEVRKEYDALQEEFNLIDQLMRIPDQGCH